jgi:hypothetical protein
MPADSVRARNPIYLLTTPEKNHRQSDLKDPSLMALVALVPKRNPIFCFGGRGLSQLKDQLGYDCTRRLVRVSRILALSKPLAKLSKARRQVS